MKYYIFTLDAHECFGPFDDLGRLHEWAMLTKHTSYQVTTEPEREPIKPWEVK